MGYQLPVQELGIFFKTRNLLTEELNQLSGNLKQVQKTNAEDVETLDENWELGVEARKNLLSGFKNLSDKLKALEIMVKKI